MQSNRREFMRSVGVMLASLLTTRCFSQPTCYEPIPPTHTPTPLMPTCYTAVPTPTPSPPAVKESDRDRLRASWHNLDQLARDAPDLERGEKTRERLIADHRKALDNLVKAGAFDSAIADEMQAAFEGAAYHVWRANSPINCYESVPYYQFEGGSDLARQVDLLAEMAEKSDIDEATVAQAQAAIERDVAFLAMSAEDQQALVELVVRAAGEGGDLPTLAELDMGIPPESVEAARILVELLLERK